MKRFLTICPALLLLMAVHAASAVTIRLLPEAVVVAGPVQLGNIAMITHADAATAQQLADTVILSAAPAAGTTIDADAVLFAILTQDGRALAGQLAFSGAAACTLTLPPAPAAEPEAKTLGSILAPANPSGAAANQPARLSGSPAVVTPAVAAPDAAGASDSTEALSALIQRAVLDQLQARPEDVRLTITTRSDALDLKAGPDQHWQLRPLVRSFLGTVQYQAQLLEGARVVRSQVVQLRVEERKPVLVAATRLERGQVVKKADLQPEMQWLDRAAPTLLTDPAQVIDQAAIRAIPAGMALDRRDFKTVEVISRGDKVLVYFTSGGLRIKIRALALASAARHERVTLRNDATGEELTATALGPKLAYVGPTLSDAQEQALLEMP